MGWNWSSSTGSSGDAFCGADAIAFHDILETAMIERDTAPPRVCFLSEEFYPVMAGVEVHVMNLAGKLLENGIKAFVVTRRLTRQLPRREEVGGIPVYRVPPTGAGPLKKWLMMMPIMAFLIRMGREYDIIYVPHFRTLGLPAVAVGKILGKKCVLMEAIHGEMSGEIFDHGLEKVRLARSALPVCLFLRFRNWIIKKADVFVSIASAVSEEYRDGGIDPRKIKRIPHGIDTDRFHPVSSEEKSRLRQKIGFSRERAVVTYVGRLVSYKGLPLLLRAWEQVAAEHGDADLVLVGPGSGGAAYDCEEELRDFVRRRSLQGHVHFAGQVENVPEYLQASDIFVFPSVKDVFAIAVIEAMSCGLPVIVAPRGGPKEIVEDGHNGLHAESLADLSQALRALLKNKALAASLGQAARRTVLERYGRQRELSAYIELFTSLKASAASG
jgi:glycosyltransferase involved in cell wall biosynthesis